MNPITYSSATIDGQLVPVFQGQAFTPGNAVGPSYQGNGVTPATIPYGVGSNTAATVNAAQAAPLSFKHSPVPLLLVMLVVSVLGLRYIHWGGR